MGNKFKISSRIKTIPADPVLSRLMFSKSANDKINCLEDIKNLKLAC